MGISIVLIDESRLFREGLRRIFEGSPFCIAYEAASFDDIEKRAAELEPLSPELLVVDSRHCGQTLLDQLYRLRQLLPQPRLVMLTDHMKLNRLAIALSAGVDGYLLKDLSGDALLQSLQLVLLGEKVFPTDLANLLVNNRIISAGDIAPHGHIAGTFELSPREEQILHCLANGYPNKVIANALDITESTVKGHLKALLKKINVQNRTQAAVWALNHGVGEDIGSLRHRAASGPRDRKSNSDCEAATSGASLG